MSHTILLSSALIVLLFLCTTTLAASTPYGGAAPEYLRAISFTQGFFNYSISCAQWVETNFVTTDATHHNILNPYSTSSPIIFFHPKQTSIGAKEIASFCEATRKEFPKGAIFQPQGDIPLINTSSAPQSHIVLNYLFSGLLNGQELFTNYGWLAFKFEKVTDEDVRIREVTEVWSSKEWQQM
mmetsp:Transcript_10710/g.40097  ORF Transcript_10710/g.40097 Transcript_10710/m.40097 type:complete len:183 (-) Transcript_10710:397-945(-)|eukprot:CAMPEP_0117435744 /NCGR_PEP_ID=MMETSP0759-20121206/641_1 /TAXON_ID=63605 /ORGANISM="Percolomonas cosmopolitus, Strain WS" /LENGTH=182 /DNA_ID=CAMNT_0005227305 /DNA_START=1038 /DNA_END=1586 /DNA_ORIENTATION=-